MKIYNHQINTIRVTNTSKKNIAEKSDDKAINSFQSVLSGKITTKEEQYPKEVQFSKHASMRLNNRSIALTDEQMKRVNEGIDKASSKGIKDSLVLVDDVALVVNTKNRVVITAMDKNVTSENVFTNIDGAVIV
jgi:flagellar operon protein